MSDEIEFTCPDCHKTLEAPADMAGGEFSCPACGRNVRVPCAAQTSSADSNDRRENRDGKDAEEVKAYCPSCGKEVLSGTDSCPHCGASLDLGLLKTLPGDGVCVRKRNRWGWCIAGLTAAVAVLVILILCAWPSGGKEEGRGVKSPGREAVSGEHAGDYAGQGGFAKQDADSDSSLDSEPADYSGGRAESSGYGGGEPDKPISIYDTMKPEDAAALAVLAGLGDIGQSAETIATKQKNAADWGMWTKRAMTEAAKTSKDHSLTPRQEAAIADGMGQIVELMALIGQAGASAEDVQQGRDQLDQLQEQVEMQEAMEEFADFLKDVQ